MQKNTTLKSNDHDLRISWLSEFKYCKRRFYLKAYENFDEQNIYVAEGITEHMSVHSGKIQKRRNLIQVSGLHVYSRGLGLKGICDMTEFTISKNGVVIPFLNEKCEIVPIEYKHGKKRDEKEYNIQLCAQALCLEEMFGCYIEKGFVYYVGSKQRFEVLLDATIRKETKDLINEIHQFINNPIVPEAFYMKRCLKCSLYDICSPKNKMIEKYMKRLRSMTK